jgi:hypothetical protein
MRLSCVMIEGAKKVGNFYRIETFNIPRFNFNMRQDKGEQCEKEAVKSQNPQC